MPHSKYGIILVVLVTTLLTFGNGGTGLDRCFCKLNEEVDDCSCKVQSVDSFNNVKVYPLLKSLLSKDYFRYFKVNLHRGCKFWSSYDSCKHRSCAVEPCQDTDLPLGLKSERLNNETPVVGDGSCSDDNELGELNSTLSEESLEAFKNWTVHDDAQDNFCELDDDSSVDMKYVDLLFNPERFTGYDGESPHRIWSAIYDENCFSRPNQGYFYGKPNSRSQDLCLEKRAFHRMISGLHTSISIHLSSIYLFKNKNAWLPDEWRMNVEEFTRRFDPETTKMMGPQWLKNLYFAYLVELRALAKVSPYLEQEAFYTGDDVADKETGAAVQDLCMTIRSFPAPFDESRLFQGDPATAMRLKEEFRAKFVNVSRIMDCVGCEKCRLWGKLQVQGMGTALKILFSGDSIGPDSFISSAKSPSFRLQRTEIVSLFNAFGRLSSSIKYIEDYRRLLQSSTRSTIRQEL